MLWKANGNGDIPDTITVDVRTDTICQPTPAMRKAMVNAAVGDAVYEEDPTVIALEKKAADLLGKEAAIMVPSGTMANLIAIMVHCTKRGSGIIAGDNAHLIRLEQGGASQLANVTIDTVKNYSNGTFNLKELRSKINTIPDCHLTLTELIILENTHNLCGGQVLPLDFLEKVKHIAQEHNVPVHMDGARIMNAAVYQKVPVATITKHVDTIGFCLSKGLGAPVGSILAGCKDFITKAHRVRKVLGGGWRKAGFLAAAGLVAIDHMVDRLQKDHDHAYKLAKAIHNENRTMFKLDLSSVQTNIVILNLDTTKITGKEVQDRLISVLPSDPIRVSVRTTSYDPTFVRFVLYNDITTKDVDAAIDKIVFVINEFEEKFKNKKIVNRMVM